jgi:anti-anti-sigma regulatory factor
MDAAKSVSPAEIENIKRYYGFDRPVHERYFRWLGKIARLDMGRSHAYGEPAWDVIQSKFPVSLFFGLTSFLLSYLVCVPLGAWKALRHRSAFDTVSSGVLFAGYVVPGFALGVLLLTFLAGGSYLDWFPLSGIVSDDWETFTAWGKTTDFLWHMTLPLVCYIAGEFAFLTILMKNSLLETVSRTGAKFAIVDLTGVDTVDTATADHLLKVMRAVGLLGARCVITGIQPSVAQIIVALGLDMQGVITLRSLREGLKYCMRTMGLKVTRIEAPAPKPKPVDDNPEPA